MEKEEFGELCNLVNNNKKNHDSWLAHVRDGRVSVRPRGLGQSTSDDPQVVTVTTSFVPL